MNYELLFAIGIPLAFGLYVTYVEFFSVPSLHVSLFYSRDEIEKWNSIIDEMNRGKKDD